MNIGDRIRKRREYLGISQSDLAKLVGISKQNLYKYEMGIITNIPLDKLEYIGYILDVSPAYLIGWEKKGSDFKNNFKISKHEIDVIIAYRNQPETQPIIDKLLKIKNKDVEFSNEIAFSFDDLSKLSIEELTNLYRKELEREKLLAERSQALQENA